MGRITERREHRGLETILFWVLPTLAVLGSLAPVSGPFFAFRVAVPLAVIASLLSGRRTQTGKRTGIRTLIVAFCWLWFIVMALLSIVGTRTDELWTEALSLGVGLLLIATTALLADTRHVLRIWANGWLAVYLLTVAIVIWELATDAHLPNYYIYQNIDLPSWAGDSSPAATLGNPNNLAFFLLASMIVLLSGRALATSRGVRILFTASALSVPVVLVSTNSRTAVAAVVAAGVIYLLFHRPLLGLVTLMAALVASLALFKARATPFGGLQRAIQEWFGDFIGGQSGSIRVNLALNGLEFLADTALVGTGPGGFQEQMARSGKYATFGITSPHNGAIEVLVQYGPLVFVTLLSLLVMFSVIGARAYRRSAAGSSERQLATALILALVLMAPMVVMNSTTIAQSFPWVYFAFLTALAIFLEGGGEELPARDAGALRFEAKYLSTKYRMSTRHRI